MLKSLIGLLRISVHLLKIIRMKIMDRLKYKFVEFQTITKFFLSLGLIAVVAVGCVAGGPHLQLESRGGEPAGEPGAVPRPTSTFNMSMGGSATAYSSENFRAYGSSTFVFGGRSEGTVYRMVGPEMSMGQERVGRSE
jgi:hypothetical protein